MFFYFSRSFHCSLSLPSFAKEKTFLWAEIVNALVVTPQRTIEVALFTKNLLLLINFYDCPFVSLLYSNSLQSFPSVSLLLTRETCAVKGENIFFYSNSMMLNKILKFDERAFAHSTEATNTRLIVMTFAAYLLVVFVQQTHKVCMLIFVINKTEKLNLNN